jgi:predicted Zn-ribbon and HTH transcriptional regulator
MSVKKVIKNARRKKGWLPRGYYAHYCFRCGYVWVSKNKHPAHCANQRCKSPYWDRPRRHPKVEGVKE